MASVPIIDLQLLPTPRDPRDIFRWGQENFRKLQDAYTSLLVFLANQNFSFVPSGMIMLWSGSAALVPPGWILCDGTSGTPDLTDKFVIGAGDTYTPDNTGVGTQTYSQTPGSYTAGVFDPGTTDASYTPGTHSDPALVESDGFTYYALAYVMKV